MGSQGREGVAELVARHRDGDPSAFEEVWRRHHGEVLRYAQSKFSDAGLAEDIAQETYIRAARYFHALGPPYRVKAWLRRIAFGVGSNMLRRRWREQPRDVIDLGADLAAEDRFSQYIEAAALRQALGRLKPQHREVLALWVQGLSCREIAVRLGEPLTTVQSRLQRAWVALRCAYHDVTAPGGGLSLVPLLSGVAALWRRARERAMQAVQGLPDPSAPVVGAVMSVTVVMAPVAAVDGGSGRQPRAQVSSAQASEPVLAAVPQVAGRSARLSVARSDALARGASVVPTGSEPAPDRPSRVVGSGAAEVFTAGPGHPERERRREQARQWGVYHELDDDWGVAADPDGTPGYAEETAEGTASGEGGAWAWDGAPVEYELYPTRPIEGQG